MHAIPSNPFQTNSVAPAKRASIGGGTVTTPAVAAHARQNNADKDLRTAESHPAPRRAAIGGGTITPLAVAAHVRKSTGQLPASNA